MPCGSSARATRTGSPLTSGRDQLDFVVEHSLQHDGYVGGWLNTENGLYYFDSAKLFPEDQLEEALLFGKENGQTSVYILSTGTDVYINYD